MITIDITPDTFTPTGNIVGYSFSSDNSALVYFKVEVKEKYSDALISVLKVYPTPANINSGFVNLSTILDNLVKWQFSDYTTNFIDSYEKPVVKYYLTITEKIVVEGVLQDGASISTDAAYGINGKADKIDFKFWDSTNYVLPQSTPIKFLTSKPEGYKVFPTSEEALYFLADVGEFELNPNITVQVNFYDNTLNEVDNISETYELSSNIKLYRINLTPFFINNHYGIDYSNVYYFKVFISNAEGETLSVERKYSFGQMCGITPINIYWVNQFGVFDTYTFINPEFTSIADKTLMKRNNIKNLVEYNDEYFNIENEVFNVNQHLEMKVYTGALSNRANNWISLILQSQQIFLQYRNEYIPIVISTTQQSLLNRKFVNGVNIKEYNFTLPDGISMTQLYQAYNFVPVNGDFRILESGEYRFTEDNQYRILD